MKNGKFIISNRELFEEIVGAIIEHGGSWDGEEKVANKPEFNGYLYLENGKISFDEKLFIKENHNKFLEKKHLCHISASSFTSKDIE